MLFKLVSLIISFVSFIILPSSTHGKLLAYWRMHNTMKDYSGEKKDLTLTAAGGSAYTTGIMGTSSRAYEFEKNSGSAFAQRTFDTNYIPQNDEHRSMCAWVAIHTYNSCHELW